MSNDLAITTNRTAIEQAIDRAELAPSTKAQYKKAVRHYLATGNSLGDAQALADYSQGVNQSTRAFLKAAVRLMAESAALQLKAGASPDNVATVQAALYRLEAIQSAVTVQQTRGERVRTWLSMAQVKELMATCGPGLVGQRDWIVLAVLVGAGLRREELINLTFDSLLYLPGKNGNRRAVLQVTGGKGGKDRPIPIKPILAERLEAWRELVGGGLVARSLGRKGIIGGSLSAIGVFHIVRKHGAMIGVPDLAPHDLRRSYAEIGLESGVSITQISRLLGHEGLDTTRRYLSLDLNLDTTISDFIPL